MSGRKIRIDFYLVEEGDGSITFLDALDQIAAMPDDDTRNHDTDVGVIRLQEFTKKNNQRRGQLVRIRMGEGPVKASILGGSAKAFDLKDDEGFGEQTAFLHDEATQVLVVQSHRIGVTPRLLAAYVAELTQGRFYLRAIETEDKLKRLNSMRDVTRFELAVASTQDAAALKGAGASVAKVNEMLEHFDAPRLQITISRGHNRKSSLPGKLVDLARKLVGQAGVEKLEITGTTDERVGDALDLIVDRLREEKTLQVNDTLRTIPYPERSLALVEAWRKHSPDLLKRYGP